MSALRPMNIEDREVGVGRPCLVIAEIGINHNGDLALAHRLIDLAVEAGADAVKFQTYRTEDLVSPDAPLAAYQSRNSGTESTQFEMLKRYELDLGAHRDLMAHARDRKVLFLSSVFDLASVRLLEEIGVEAVKVPSGEITNLPLLEAVARFGRPAIVSTGMAAMAEVARAVEAIEPIRDRTILLHCVSDYPAAPADCNLRALHTLAERFSLPVGFSDHTPGIEIAVAAVALGACVIEKHFTLSRRLPGVDHAASLEPDEFGNLVRSIRAVEAALGDGVKMPTAAELDTARVARKSLFSARPIAAGEALSPEAVAIKRPGTGLPPGRLGELVGRRARWEIPAGRMLGEEMFE